MEEAHKSLAWALQVDPASIQLPATVAKAERTAWLELFRYPRSLAASCQTGISQTGISLTRISQTGISQTGTVGLSLWLTTLLVLVLKITRAWHHG